MWRLPCVGLCDQLEGEITVLEGVTNLKCV